MSETDIASEHDGPPGVAPGSGRHDALRAAERWLRRAGLRLAGYVIAAYLLIRLLPALREALEDLERPSWGWLVLMFGLETLSELGFVVSWQAIVDPEGRLTRSGRRLDLRVAWAQLGAGMFVPGGSLSSVGAGTWLLHRLGMPLSQIAERQFSLSLLNTAIDAIALIVFGVALALGLLPGERDLLLTLLPAAIAALGITLVLAVASRARARRSARGANARHPRIRRALDALPAAVQDTARLLTHRRGARSVAGALAYLFLDVLVLFFAFSAIRAHPAPTFGVVVMAYIIGALGGSVPLPAAVGTVGGMVGMFLVYGVHRDTAVAAVLIYQAVGLLVPLIGGAIAYALLRREFASPGDPAAAESA